MDELGMSRRLRHPEFDSTIEFFWITWYTVLVGVVVYLGFTPQGWVRSLGEVPHLYIKAE
jgi:hypothetical protein